MNLWGIGLNGKTKIPNPKVIPLVLAGRPKVSPTADLSTAVIKNSLTVLYPKSWRSGGTNLEFASELPPLIVQNKQRLIKPC